MINYGLISYLNRNLNFNKKKNPKSDCGLDMDLYDQFINIFSWLKTLVVENKQNPSRFNKREIEKKIRVLVLVHI